MYTYFNNKAIFGFTNFNNKAIFYSATFNNQAIFGSTIFNNQAIFGSTIFKGNADFRNVRTEATLAFDNTMWEGRVDLHSISAKELHWESTITPSEVKGVFDLREATIGRATFNEVRFQDTVDFSRTIFGPYKVGVRLPPSWNFRPHVKVPGPLSRSVVPLVSLESIRIQLFHETPFTRFANNTFENSESTPYAHNACKISV